MIVLWTREVSEGKALVAGTHYQPFDPVYGITDDNGNLISKEDIKKMGGVFVESELKPEPNDKLFVHFVNPQTGEQWYEYEERPKTEMELMKEELATVKAENKELQLAIAESAEVQQRDKIENQLAVAELVETLTNKEVL
ncbi:hypothetical protein [Lysinibacillus sp. NPDC093688]|uniref:hypothetical protein n=1 Tax=Lysinibacillus sp. NPDC093688 TaxID=3390577 RepID=UPI003D00D91A